MLVQAWSEHTNRLFQRRVEEFFTEVKVRLESVEALQIADFKRLLSVEAQAALLEETIAAASREPSAEKRETFANFYVAAISGRLGNHPDPVRSLLQTLEALTLSDVNYLKIFGRHGTASGDTLSGTARPMFLGAPVRSEKEWEELLAPIQLSVTKLETRGLIFSAARKSAFMHEGDGSAWFNRFREKAWRISQPGRQLLSAISSAP
jgi:hypothetical protein